MTDLRRLVRPLLVLLLGLVAGLGCVKAQPPVPREADPPSPPAPAPALRDQVVYRTPGPDDGPGVTLALGEGPAHVPSCDVFARYGHADELPRLFAEGPILDVELLEPTYALPRTVPATGTQWASATRCPPEGPCERPVEGTITITRYAEGSHLAGHLDIVFPSGRIRRGFEATWCGPTVADLAARRAR